MIVGTMRPFILPALLALSLTSAYAQQMPDRFADVRVADPAILRDKGPSVVIDAAHHNIHTVDGGYEPFADLLRNDGFRVSGSNATFTADALRPIDILVISNAVNGKNVADWVVPVYSAFTADEIAAVRAWVEGGGSLLLIADHFPMAGAAADLAAAFGFTIHNGYAVGPRGPGIFTLADGSLKDDPILRGRKASEAVRKIVTFTGSAFDMPQAARPIIVLPKGFEVRFPERVTSGPFLDAAPRRDAAGLGQGAVMDVGKGRLALFGEAAMFSAQRILNSPSGAPGVMGFNHPDANENKQFILNLVRWLGHVS
jgi:hypothetical protein